MRRLLKHLLLVRHLRLELSNLLVVDDPQVPLEVAPLVVRVFAFVRQLQSQLLGAHRALHLPDVVVNLHDLYMTQVVHGKQIVGDDDLATLSHQVGPSLEQALLGFRVMLLDLRPSSAGRADSSLRHLRLQELAGVHVLRLLVLRPGSVHRARRLVPGDLEALALLEIVRFGLDDLLGGVNSVLVGLNVLRLDLLVLHDLRIAFVRVELLEELLLHELAAFLVLLGLVDVLNLRLIRHRHLLHLRVDGDDLRHCQRLLLALRGFAAARVAVLLWLLANDQLGVRPLAVRDLNNLPVEVLEVRLLQLVAQVDDKILVSHLELEVFDLLVVRLKFLKEFLLECIAVIELAQG